MRRPEEPDTGWLEVAAGVAAFVMLLFRRRWPFALLTVTVAASWLHVVILDRPTPMLMAAFVMLATTAVRLERWPAMAVRVDGPDRAANRLGGRR